ncbi:HAUS augmin-like complex subunit 6, N-terminal [Cinara cedri]|uniref:HAUS augmin-like complex subunit 6, N-terminal n=1 Tax=Cinara cedri TaxID=506608 RepID=A0A5E4NFU2_9HEMI|nr:HAUS augmin-like complex subunit 6, N-terminal [Cinara cedri]
MEARITYHIKGIFMLCGKPIPPTLNKHLTNKIFNKPNKEAMEQVLYFLLTLTDPNCLKTVPWPITTFKEAAEFRNTATFIINNLKGFVYEKSSNVTGKVNSSLLANPGGSIFIFFIYQLCLYVKGCELKKKGISVLSSPLFVDNEYIEKKISMYESISKSNFNEVNETISRIDYILKKTTELSVKWKEIIQDSKQHIKDLKFELVNIEHCGVTEKEVVELKQKYINLYNNFEQNKLLVLKCVRLAEIILKTPETWDANVINLNFYTNKEEFIRNDGPIDFIKLLIIIKTTLNDYINWCEQLNNEKEIIEKIHETQQSINDMTDQIKCYKKIIEVLNNVIDRLKNENQILDDEVFNSKNFENIDPILQSVYKRTSPIVLRPDCPDTPKLITLEDKRKSRRSTLLHCASEPFCYQSLSFNDIKEVYKNTLQNQNEDVYENRNTHEHLSILYESNLAAQATVSQTNDIENSQDKINTSLYQSLSRTNLTEIDEKDVLNTAAQTQIKEDEVKSFSISRKSIENLKQKFIRIKQSKIMNTIPHSPQSPF